MRPLNLSYLAVLFLPFVIKVQPSDVIRSLLVCPLDDLRRTLSGLTFFRICPRCELWPQRWNACNITQIDCLLPVLALLWSCTRGKRWGRIRPSLSVAQSEEKQTQPPPVPKPFQRIACARHEASWTLFLGQFTERNKVWCLPNQSSLDNAFLNPSRGFDYKLLPFSISGATQVILWDHFLSKAFFAL